MVRDQANGIAACHLGEDGDEKPERGGRNGDGFAVAVRLDDTQQRGAVRLGELRCELTRGVSLQK